MKNSTKIRLFSLAAATLIVLGSATPAFASTFSGSLSGGTGGIVISAPTVTPAAGTYTSAQSATLSAANSDSIHYTNDGTIPTCTTGTTYSAAISVGSSFTIKALSCYGSGESAVASSVGSFGYTINIPAPAPAPSGGGGGGGSAGGDGHSLFPVAPVLGVVPPPVVSTPVQVVSNATVEQTPVSVPTVVAASETRTQTITRRSVAPVVASVRKPASDVRVAEKPAETRIETNSSQVAGAASVLNRQKIQWGPQIVTVDYGIGQLYPYIPWFILFLIVLILLSVLSWILRTSSDDIDVAQYEPQV